MATKTQIIKYAVLPGIIPRIMEFVRSGFAHIAYLIAVLYNTVRLLPPNHPYLDPRNMGKFGIRHVIAEASKNLVFKRQNIDQIIIFFTIIIGLVLLLGQFLILGFTLLASNPVIAATTVQITSQMFSNPSTLGAAGPADDLAFIILDRVFGVPHIFDSCIAQGVACWEYTRVQDSVFPVQRTQMTTIEPFGSVAAASAAPVNNFHTALHTLLQFYSYGIFLVAVMVIIYYVITIVAETAQTGTPFGQRFNKAWAPVRLILFFGMIIPFSSGSPIYPGFNMAQLVTLKTAQLGSNMSTNAWAYFNGGAVNAAGGPAGATAGSTFLTQQKKMVATPKFKKSAVSEMIQFIHLARTCSEAYAKIADITEKDIEAYLVRSSDFNGAGTAGTIFPDSMALIPTNYQQALDFFMSGKMTIRFGLAPTEPNRANWDSIFKSAMGNIAPMCGDLTLNVNSVGEPGAIQMSRETYELIKEIWQDPLIMQSATCLVDQYGVIAGSVVDLTCNNLMTPNDISGWLTTHGTTYADIVQRGIDTQNNTANLIVSQENIAMGWVGASIYYNKIAQMNGAVTAAAGALPFKSKLPYLLEYALAKNTIQNANISTDGQFSTLLSDALGQNALLDLDDPKDYRILRALRAAYHLGNVLGFSETSSFEKPTGNAVIDLINMVLGTSGIFDMRNNTDVHPLAQLSALGKGMMDAAIRNAAIAVGGAIGANALKIFDDFASDASKSISNFFSSMVVATIGIAAVLYYVLPLLPFIYFFFAVSGWIKSIFEAVVAMPLWALAHIRIDGEGLPGPGATNGYFLLLEIFLRPILILTGFIASISIFGAVVTTLNFIFDIVVANVGGFDYATDNTIQQGGGVPGMITMLQFSRGPIDEFFYTGMYTVICYMIGIACFKLIDQIPNKILRWAGVSASTFQENAGDPASQLTNQVYKGSLLIGNQVKRAGDSTLAILTS